MKCIVLAAGYATRLYPLTENFPKPLLQVGGKTILDWLLDDLRGGARIDEFIVVSNHKFAGIFEEWASRSDDVRVVDDGTLTNETRLGAVRDIRFALEAACIDDDILVTAGDNLLNFSLSSFVSYAAVKGTSCVMRYAEPDENRLRKCGVLEIDDSDRILSMEEKPSEPRSHWCCPPFYLYTRKDVALVAAAVADGCAVDAPGSLAAWMCRHSPMHAMLMPGDRFDIGNLESYDKVCRTYCKVEE